MVGRLDRWMGVGMIAVDHSNAVKYLLRVEYPFFQSHVAYEGLHAITTVRYVYDAPRIPPLRDCLRGGSRVLLCSNTAYLIGSAAAEG
jgi:hypothetical protein